MATDEKLALLEKIHKEVQDKVNAYSAVGGKWGPQLKIDPSGPIYPLLPDADTSGLGFVDTIAKYGRTGNYTGAAFGGGKLSPTFNFQDYDLTKESDWTKFNKEFSRFSPGVNGSPDGEFYIKPRALAPRSAFDAASETHDLLQQDANLKYADAYRRAGAEYQALVRQGASDATLKAASQKVIEARDQALAAQKTEYAKSDGWIIREFNKLVPSNPYEAVLKNIGVVVFSSTFSAEFIEKVDLSTQTVAGELGEAFGSRLGALIAGNGFFQEKIGTSVGRELGRTISVYFASGGQGSLMDSLLGGDQGDEPILATLFEKSLKTFDINIEDGWKPASFKGVGQFLVAEAAERLNLEGFEKYVFTRSGQSLTNYFLDTLSGGPVNAEGFAAIVSNGMNIGSVTAFVTDLAIQYFGNNYVDELLSSTRKIVSIDNRYEGYFAEMHAIAAQAIGQYVGTTVAGPFIGSLIGKILGAIGYLWGSAKYELLDALSFGVLDQWFTPDPVGVNYTVFNPVSGLLETDFAGSRQHWDRNNASNKVLEELRKVADAAGDAFTTYINSVIDASDSRADVSAFTSVLEKGQRYNHASIGYHSHAFQVIRSANGDKVHSNDIKVIVSAAVEYEMSKMVLQGGDLTQLRAINSWKFDTAMKTGKAGARLGDDYILSTNILGARLQTAQDYHFYLENAETINYLMSQAPDTPFTVGWTATLMQAYQMRLNAPYSALSMSALDNTATAKDDKIYSADGNDSLFGADGNDLIKTYGGNDKVGGGNGNDTVYAGAGDDTVLGGGGDDVLITGAGRDIVYGDAGADQIQSGDGNDVVAGGNGSDVIDTGAGFDVAYIHSAYANVAITRNGAQLTVKGHGEADIYTDVEALVFLDGRIILNTARKIGTFDEGFYLQHNPDVAGAVQAGQYRNGLQHWMLFGKVEGRPAINSTADPLYDEVYYLSQNPDVAEAVHAGRFVSGYVHYMQWGKAEGRDSIPLFDREYYLSMNPDVKASGMDAVEHYNRFGWREGRDPSPLFDTSDYLYRYSDIKLAGVNPLEHALTFGFAEGRTINVTADAILPATYILF